MRTRWQETNDSEGNFQIAKKTIGEGAIVLMVCHDSDQIRSMGRK